MLKPLVRLQGFPGNRPAVTRDRTRARARRARGGTPMRRWRGPFIALLILALALPAWAQEKPRSGGELVFVVPSEPPSYDAHQEETFGVIHPMAPHYSTLLKVDPFDKSGTKPVGDVAESWTVSKDGLTYTFKLRKGVKFHDGSELTSKDVKASYDKILKPPAGVKSLRKDMYDAVISVEAADSKTAVFKLKWTDSS